MILGYQVVQAAPICLVGSAQDSTIQAPASLKPFEHLIGTWKGVGIPTGNKLKGWQETHVFGWTFEKGQPVSLNLDFTGNKLIAKGQLKAQGDDYVLEGTDPDEVPVKWSGKLDAAAQTPTLILTPDAPPGDGPSRRLVVRLLSNKEGYTFWDERKTGSKYAKSVEIRMSRNDPSIGASRAGSTKPKCIITGGEGTISVTYNGKSYPVCCTGCRDEFLAEPEKYLAKLAKKTEMPGETTLEPASEEVSKKELGAEPLADPKKSEKEATPKPAPDKADELLKRAQDLENSGSKQAAVIYYQRVVKEFGESAQAKTASQRIKVLGGKR